MTVNEMVIDLFEQLGKPSDLRPYAADGETVDLASSGGSKLLGWINRGYKKILTWKYPNGRMLRFRVMEKEAFFKAVTVIGTAQAGTASTITLAAATSNTVNRYRSWIVEITDGTGAGQRRMIVQYSAARVATVHKSWTTTPDATSVYRLSKNFYLFSESTDPLLTDNIALSATSEVMSVMAVTDLEDGRTVSRANRTDTFADVVSSNGSPSLYVEFDGGISFDSTVDDDRYFRLRYHGFPPAFTLATQQPLIPPQFHEGILLWAVWWGLRRNQEFDGAYSTKRDLVDMMQNALEQYDMSTEREDFSLYIGG